MFNNWSYHVKKKSNIAVYCNSLMTLKQYVVHYNIHDVH
jgi:hypothetical protein